LGFDPKRIDLEYDVSNMRDKPPAELFGMRWAPCFTDLECASSTLIEKIALVPILVIWNALAPTCGIIIAPVPS
jgi:hypothetical protein